MKRERIQMPENPEEVSSHPGEKGRWSQKWHRNSPCAREKRKADWKIDLQNCGEGRKSRKQLKTAHLRNEQQIKWEIPVCNPEPRKLCNCNAVPLKVFGAAKNP